MAMTLKEFIGEALSEIILGIDEAKKRLEDSDRAHWVSAPIAAIGAGQAIHDTDVAVWNLRHSQGPADGFRQAIGRCHPPRDQDQY